MNRSVIIIDQALVGYSGHNFEYDACLLRAARTRGDSLFAAGNRGMDSAVARALSATPVFRDSRFFPRLAKSKMLNFALDPFVANAEFYRDLRSYANPDTRAVGSTLFVPNVSHRNLIGLALWLLPGRKMKIERAVLLIRLSYYLAEKSRWSRQALWLRFGLFLLRALHGRRKIRLATDSDFLSADLRKLTGMPIVTLPVPFVFSEEALPPMNLNQDLRRPQSPVRFLLCGNARLDKGFALFVESVKYLKEELESGKIQFSVQCNTQQYTDPEIRSAISFLRTSGLPGISLIDKPLTTGQYLNLLAESDVVLLPYWRDRYRASTSGILIESLALGKPVVVTAGTWMTEQVKDRGVAVTFEDRNPADLARAIKSALADVDALSNRARAYSSRVREEHSPLALYDALFSDNNEPEI